MKTNKKPKYVESTVNIVRKYEGLKQRYQNPDAELSEFEIKMMWAFERTLGERGYFKDMKVDRPMAWKEPHAS